MRDALEALAEAFHHGWLAKDLISLAVIAGFLVCMAAWLPELAR